MSVNPHKSNLFSLAVLILARYRAAFLLAILLIISITLVPSAQAALILLDQEYVPSPPPGGGFVTFRVDREVEDAQTFTVGLAGQLVRVDLFLALLNPTEEITLDIRPTIGGVPVNDDSASLFSSLITGLSAVGPTFFTFSLGSGIPVATGDVLAIALTNFDDESVLPGGQAGWVTEEETVYDRGVHYVRGTFPGFSSDTWAADFPGSSRFQDVGFRTFVLVPVPGAFILFGSGLIVLRFMMRRRKAA